MSGVRGCTPADRRLRGALPLLVALAACDGSGAPVVVGVASGESFLEGARLAFEDGGAVGPIEGLDTVLIAEGTNRSESALRAAERLVAVPGIAAVVGHANSAASLAASQVYNAHEVVQIAPTSTAVAYSGAGPFSFRMVPPDDRQGRFLAETVMDAFPDGARLAVFYVNDDYGRGLRAELVAHLDTTRYHVPVDLPHAEESLDSLDVQSGVGAAVAARPDAIIWLARSAILGSFLPGFRRELGSIPVYGGDAVARAVQESHPPELWDGVAYTDFVDAQASEELRSFDARFRRRFGTPAGGPEILTYDAIGLVLAALRDGRRTGPEIRDWLRSLGHERPAYVGISGPVSFDEDGNVERTFVLKVIGEGAPP
jgi:branched-chain amino acid transport system substrate-binding protein